MTIIPNSHEIIPPLEIDIAIPELSIAIEWNGIFHRKPIGGEQKLKKRQKRDREKKKRLEEMKWDLYIVETDLKYNEEYINLICENISTKIRQKRKEIKEEQKKEIIDLIS